MVLLVIHTIIMEAEYNELENKTNIEKIMYKFYGIK